MVPEYAQRYRDLYHQHWWWRAREALLVRTLEHLSPHGGWNTILDVGCGDGLFFGKLQQFGTTLEGVESDASLVSENGPWRRHIHVGSFDSSFQPANAYSLILMLDMLEHLADPLSALQHAVRLLEPRGHILLTVPAFEALWTSHDDYNEHRTRFTRARFARLARDAGMRIDSARYFFHWTCPIKLAQRLKERLLPGVPAPAGIPPRWANKALYLTSRLEQTLLEPFPIPFGSSLLIVGGRADGDGR
jgi:SAM-dependent methyltransferase